MSEEEKPEKEARKLTWDESRVDTKRKKPIKHSIPIGDNVEMEIEYYEVTGVKVEELELQARRDCTFNGVVDELQKEKNLTESLFDSVMATYLGQPWSELVRREISSGHYAYLSEFVKGLVTGNR